MRRRDFLKRAGALTLALPALEALSACGDDATPTESTDTSDGGPDAPDTADTGADTADTAPLPDYVYDGPLGPETIFEHGVASGDPLPDRVILWTRAAVTRAPSPDPELEVFWEVARDAAFTNRVAAGTTFATAATDHCVKVDASGLTPATTYYYRFFSLGRSSPVGRTRTAPTGSTPRLTFAVCSCSNMPVGYFHAYREMSQRADLDLVLHLGDYIYEGGPGSGPRAPEPPRELLTLDDYRRRYAQYRRDPDLQAAHRQHPFVVVWDDHETANDAWRDGAEKHDPATEGPYAERRAAASQAWREWLPVRVEDDGPIYRRFDYGDLVDLIMLDTRIHGRDEQAAAVDDPAIDDPTRQLLGADQEAWLSTELGRSNARWTVIGQQVMMGQLRAFGYPLNVDQWDGYAPARQRFFDAVKAAGIDNLVVLTGDIHSSWAIDLREDTATYDPRTGAGALGVELVAPGVTSTGLFASGDALFEQIRADLPHIQWADLSRRGWIELDLDEARAEATWRLFERVDEVGTASEVGAVFATSTGAHHLVTRDTPTPPRASPPPLAP